MDAIVKQMQDVLEGQIVGLLEIFQCPIHHLTVIQDFEGQRVSEIICTVLLSLTSVSLDPAAIWSKTC
jgi:hypothetical protein